MAHERGASVWFSAHDPRIVGMTSALHSPRQHCWCHHYDLSAKVSDTTLLFALRAPRGAAAR